MLGANICVVKVGEHCTSSGSTSSSYFIIHNYRSHIGCLSHHHAMSIFHQHYESSQSRSEAYFFHCLLFRTCLHWACKRNHKPVVSYLLNSGADQEILTAKDELAVQLTSKPEIRRLLGGKCPITSPLSQLLLFLC